MTEEVPQTKWVCEICGALFIEDQGFVERHRSPCANERHGWNYCREVPLDWDRASMRPAEPLAL